jgi:hypothetical protein
MPVTVAAGLDRVDARELNGKQLSRNLLVLRRQHAANIAP